MKALQKIAVYRFQNIQGKLLCMLFFTGITCQELSAQKFTATTDRDKMLIGEQLILTLQLTNINPEKFTCEGWPLIPDSFQQCEVVKRGIIDTILINRLQTIRQQVVITSFDSGSHTIGPYQMVLISKEGARKTTLKTSTIPLTVLMPDVSNLMDYHEMKDVIDTPEPFDWKFTVITGLIALTVTFMLWKLFTKQKKNDGPVSVIPPEKALVRALDKLDKLQNSPLKNKVDMKHYHAALDNIMREYIEQASAIRALKATAYEVQQQLQVYIPTQGLKEKIEHIFLVNTSVKYALFMPGENESRLLREDIIYCLKILDDTIQQAHRYAG